MYLIEVRDKKTEPFPACARVDRTVWRHRLYVWGFSAKHEPENFHHEPSEAAGDHSQKAVAASRRRHLPT
jgi:hypothetical protein